MELFVVNRYGEENNKDVEESKQALILQRLQKKIEKRKKARQRLKDAKRSKPKTQSRTEVAEAEVEQDAEEDLESDEQQSEAEDYLKSEREVKVEEKSAAHESTEENDEQNSLCEKDEEIKDVATEINGTITKDTVNNKNQTEIGGFTILGSHSFQKKLKVRRVLPYWLANPTVMSSDLKEKTCDLDSIKQLSKTLKSNLRSSGVEYLFPVQATLVPWLLDGLRLPEPFRQEDVCVSAPTGSGKTLAFVLPIVQALSTRVVCRIRALVLLPVHELAIQVAKVFRKMCEGTNLKVALLAARTTFAAEQNLLVKKSHSGAYLSNVDIVVCTAGRLVEHLNMTPGFSLKYLKYLVLDEADKVMDSTQNDWLQHLEKHLKMETNQECISTKLSLSNLEKYNTRPQKLLFSATLSQDPEKLQRIGLFQPKLFTTLDKNVEPYEVEDEKRGIFVGRYTTPAELEEYQCLCELQTKPLSLYLLIKREGWKQILCFANSSKAAHRLSILLQYMAKDMKVSELSGSLGFKTREETLRKFSEGDINILISTDAMARGMDIGNVEVVISYDSPKYIKNYIHRIGRTARAGKSGKAVTLLHKQQIPQFQKILKNGGKDSIPELQVTTEELEEGTGGYNEALESLKIFLQKEDAEEVLKTKSEKCGKLKKRKHRSGKNKSKKLKMDEEMNDES